MEIVTEEFFPLSKKSTIKGNRRLAREKVLQILNAFEVCDLSIEKLFNHIFSREFNFEENKSLETNPKILTPDEVLELEADIPIIWKESDIEFTRLLLNQILEHKAEVLELLTKYAANWEIERMAAIDRILMMMAITELLYFPDIPSKVSINEAIDIAKSFSTDKSSLFINGILDKILLILNKQGKVQKIGRGLQENK